MNKSLAVLLLVGAVAACDPWIDDDCLVRDELPRRAMGAYWLHGVMSYVQALYMFAIMGAYISGLTVLGPLMEGLAFAAAGINFITYIPNAIIWTLTAADTNVSMFRHYYRALKATNVIGWFIWLFNIAIFLVLVLATLLDGIVSIAAGESMPSFILPLVGLILDLAFQIIYATTYGYSRTLMKCWGYDFPELGGCSGFRAVSDL